MNRIASIIFDPEAMFEKWALVEVKNFEQIPTEMETYNLSGGLYAVFLHKGMTDIANNSFTYIFKTWLPNSGYVLDNREHFEILGEKFIRDSSDLEEEVWIPITIIKISSAQVY